MRRIEKMDELELYGLVYDLMEEYIDEKGLVVPYPGTPVQQMMTILVYANNLEESLQIINRKANDLLEYKGLDWNRETLRVIKAIVELSSEALGELNDRDVEKADQSPL